MPAKYRTIQLEISFGVSFTLLKILLLLSQKPGKKFYLPANKMKKKI